MGLFGLFGLFGNKKKKKAASRNNGRHQNTEFVKQNLLNEERIINDSIKLINETTNPEVFFSRYETLLEAFDRIVDIVRINALGENALNEALASKEKYKLGFENDLSAFINRCYSKTEEKISSLTTEKAKKNHAEKFLAILDGYDVENSHVEEVKYLYGLLNFSNHDLVESNQQREKIEKQVDIQKNEISEFDIYNQWNISLSFGKSTSKNFSKAIYIAKSADRYIEDIDEDGNEIYQAFFLAGNYLNFQRLYKLIGNWKSTFIFINGEIIDNKSLGKINICYGDKVKFNDPSFCFGASMWTANPFGCHRLMITPTQKPWWDFGDYNTRGDWVIDKNEIRSQIKMKSKLFQKCPAFDLTRALAAVDKLPNVISPKRDSRKWIFSESGVYPSNGSLLNSEITKMI